MCICVSISVPMCVVWKWQSCSEQKALKRRYLQRVWLRWGHWFCLIHSVECRLETNKHISSCNGFSFFEESRLAQFSTKKLLQRKSRKRNWTSKQRRHLWHVFICPRPRHFALTYSELNKMNWAGCTHSQRELRLEFRHFVIVSVIYP